MAGAMDGLRAKAREAVANNALAMAGLTPSLRPMSLEARAGRWWDLPAKHRFAEKVYREENERRPGGNDAGDAMRHAQASKRLAETAGPVFAAAAGFGHEMVNLRRSLIEHGPAGPYDRSKFATPGQTLDEIQMDLRNNAEGRRAAREGRAVDPRNLQTLPVTPKQAPLYRSPPAGVEGLPPR